MTFTLRRSIKVAFYLIVWVGLLSCGLFIPPATVTPTVFSPTNTSTPPPTSTVTPTVPPTATRDPRITNPQNQHLYLYVEKNRNWHDARDYCAAQGGHLVTIDSASENDFIFRLTGGNTWLGATDEVQEGIWVWVTGETWSYSNWDKGEPNNCCPPENCGATGCTPEHYLVYSDSPPAWNDVPRIESWFVCEWE